MAMMASISFRLQFVLYNFHDFRSQLRRSAVRRRWHLTPVDITLSRRQSEMHCSGCLDEMTFKVYLRL